MAAVLPRILIRGLISSACTRAPAAPVPQRSATPADFLQAIGRGLDSKLSLNDWDAFWACDRLQLKQASLSVQDRRYFLWCKEKFKQGWNPEVVAYGVKGKKKVRGRGPAVQNGKRIRSRRLKK